MEIFVKALLPLLALFLISCAPWSANHNQFDTYDYDRYNQYESDKEAVLDELDHHKYDSAYDSDTREAIDEAVKRNK